MPGSGCPSVTCTSFLVKSGRTGTPPTFPISAGPYVTWRILERSRTALCRLIDATTKPSSSLNTAPISDFLGPAAQKIQTFSRARKKSWIRILPPEPALQTYTFWPIGVPQRRWLARYCSVPAFFCTDGTAASNVVIIFPFRSMFHARHWLWIRAAVGQTITRTTDEANLFIHAYMTGGIQKSKIDEL